MHPESRQNVIGVNLGCDNNVEGHCLQVDKYSFEIGFAVKEDLYKN